VTVGGSKYAVASSRVPLPGPAVIPAWPHGLRDLLEGHAQARHAADRRAAVTQLEIICIALEHVACASTLRCNSWLASAIAEEELTALRLAIVP